MNMVSGPTDNSGMQCEENCRDEITMEGEKVELGGRAGAMEALL